MKLAKLLLIPSAVIGLAAATSPAQATTLTTICAFGDSVCPTGTTPLGALLRDSSGNLYGTTSFGGLHNGGTVFRLSFSGGAWHQTVLYEFCATGGGSCTDGSVPESALIMDVNGNLFGTTSRDGPNGTGAVGTVFKLTPTVSPPWTLTTLHGFCSLGSCNDGEAPQWAGLAYKASSPGALYDESTDGPLYGVASAGGTNAEGVVFRLTPSGGSFSYDRIHNFCTSCDTGGSPQSAVTVTTDASHTYLYGVARNGHHLAGGGVVYKLTDASMGNWPKNDLFNFCSDRSGGSCFDGKTPYATVFVEPTSGNVLSTTGAGGDYTITGPTGGGGGELFEVTDTSAGGTACTYGTITEGCILFHKKFCNLSNCTDGWFPNFGLSFVMAPDGKWYGETTGGGSSSGADSVNGGVIYKLSGPTHSTYAAIYNFCNAAACGSDPSDGNSPQGGLIADSSNNLYGVTQKGGGHGNKGTVFVLTP